MILAINVTIFLLMMFAGGPAQPETLRAFGAKDNELILAGEYWRLITPIFIHINIIHIGLNSYALLGLGPAVEKFYGSARFLFIYLCSGIVGVAASFFWSLMSGRIGLSAGASGAIFGLFGALAVFALKYRKELPEKFRRSFGTSIFITIVINLWIGYALPIVDNAAHIGGMVAGALITLFLSYQAARPRGRNMALLVTEAVCLIIIALSFVPVGLRYQGPRLGLQGFEITRALGVDMFFGARDLYEKVVGFNDSFNVAEYALRDSYISLRRAYLSKQQVNANELLGLIDHAKLALGGAPVLDDKAKVFVERLSALLDGNRRMIEKYQAGQLTESDLEAQYDRYQLFARDFGAWTQTAGRTYGINYRPEELK